jgi:hypothetical protein
VSSVSLICKLAIQLEVPSPECIVLGHRSSHADRSGVIATMPVRKQPTAATQRHKQPRPVIVADAVGLLQRGVDHI